MTDCMCRGCYAGFGASLHYVPKDPEIRQKWIEFIYKNRTAPKFKNLDRIRICSAHFNEECFTNYRQKMMGFGKRLILKPNAVPTIPVQLEFPAPRRTRQEKLEETTAETRLCPLCQRHQKDSDALSLHLTKKHSVHPACLGNLLLNAPYLTDSSGGAQESSTQNNNGTAQQKNSESTKSPLMTLQRDGSQEDHKCDESGEGNMRSCFCDIEASFKDDKYKNNRNPVGGVNYPLKCHACKQCFTHKSELSVHYKSDTHMQKLRKGAGNDGDSSTPVLAYPYVSTKPYQCDVCHVSYFYSFGLESHLKSVLHQSRTRKAGNTITYSQGNTDPGITLSNLAGSTVANHTELASAKTYNCPTQADKVQLPPTSSLLPTSVMSASGMPTVLPLLTLAPNSLPHTIAPSAFPHPGTSATQLIHQPQVLMPLIMNGLQSPNPDSPQPILQQTVPVLGLHLAQQSQGLGSSDAQRQSATTGVSSAPQIPLKPSTTIDGVGVKVKIEIKEEPCDQEVSQMTPCTADAISQVCLKREYNSLRDGIEARLQCGDNQQCNSDANQTSTIPALQSSHGTKSNTTKCSTSHVLIPSSTKTHTSLSSGPPVLTEFQSQVLWAFFESRNEAGPEIPSKEDCEALGREVGLTEDEVLRWLVDTRCTKDRIHADVQSQYERQGSTEDEDALIIDESGGMVLRSTTDFLSDDDVDDDQTTAGKKRKRAVENNSSEEDSGRAEC